MRRAPLVLLVLALACRGGRPPAPRAAGDESSYQPPAGVLATSVGQLQVFATTPLTDGRRMRIRGMVRNPYPQPVDGVRLTLRLSSHAGTEAEELERFQRVVELRLEPQASAPVHWDVESSYVAGTGASGVDLQAFAVRRGDESLPPPSGWRR